MVGRRPPEQTDDMLTPIVTEIPRVLEPVARDTFIAPRELDNVVQLIPRDLRGPRATLVPARAA